MASPELKKRVIALSLQNRAKYGQLKACVAYYVKSAHWPRVSSECLHRVVMDGAFLFPRRGPANCTLIVFQSAALNYSAELMPAAHSWKASPAVLRYQKSEFDCGAALCN